MQGTRAGIYYWQEGEEAYPLPATEVAQTVLGNVESWDKDATLHLIKKPLKILQEVGIFSIRALVNKKGTRLLSARDVARNLEYRALTSKYKRSLENIAKVVASQDYGNFTGTSDRGYEVDSNLRTWLKRKIAMEQEHLPVPAKTLEEIYAIAPREVLKQKTAHMVCGGKRKERLTLDPELRQADTIHEAAADAEKPPTTLALAEEQRQNDCIGNIELADPKTDMYTLTRRNRAMKMLSLKTPAVTVYNSLCAQHKDKVEEVTGRSRTVGKHTRWQKRSRRLLDSQLQWEVKWAPTVLEGWEKDLAINQLKYRPSILRPAAERDLMRVPPMCEHCHKKEGVARCSHCRRGFHTGQGPNNLQGAAQRLTEDCDLISNGMCWECRRYDPELDDGDSYDLQTEPWYIEWEPSWEDANTMRQLGYEGVVIQTLAARETGQT